MFSGTWVLLFYSHSRFNRLYFSIFRSLFAAWSPKKFISMSRNDNFLRDRNSSNIHQKWGSWCCNQKTMCASPRWSIHFLGIIIECIKNKDVIRKTKVLIMHKKEFLINCYNLLSKNRIDQTIFKPGTRSFPNEVAPVAGRAMHLLPW